MARNVLACPLEYLKARLEMKAVSVEAPYLRLLLHSPLRDPEVVSSEGTSSAGASACTSSSSSLLRRLYF